MQTKTARSPKLILIIPILLAGIFLSSPNLMHAAETWTFQNTPVTSGALYDFFFTDSNTG